VFNRLIQSISEQDLRSLSRWLPLALALCLVALVAPLLWHSYQTFYFQPSVDRIAAAAPQGQPYSAQAITQGNLFGRSQTAPAAAKLPATNLQLILRGAFGAITPEKGTAMIESGDGVTRSYRVNMQVSANTRLHGVFPNHVVLSRDGKLETLEFPSLGSVTGSSGPPNTGNNTGNNTRNNSGSNAGNHAAIIPPSAQRHDTATMSAQQRQQLIKLRLQELRNRSKNRG
jgi:general secretion pathway protein C